MQRRTLLKTLLGLFGLGTAKVVAAPSLTLKGVPIVFDQRFVPDTPLSLPKGAFRIQLDMQSPDWHNSLRRYWRSVPLEPSQMLVASDVRQAMINHIKDNDRLLGIPSHQDTDVLSFRGTPVESYSFFPSGTVAFVP